MEQYKTLYNTLPKAVVADAGYGSDENYAVLQQKQIDAYIKYNTFDKEQKEGIKAFSNEVCITMKRRTTRFAPWASDGAYRRRTKNHIIWLCPNDQPGNGPGIAITARCGGLCHSGQSNRIVEVNHSLRQHKQVAKDRLNTEQGINIENDDQQTWNRYSLNSSIITASGASS